ncbi:MAG: radical SAM protein [Lachnospiraceae bacterium]|nr:radical SAM protein [Lachnospiraceae bacterium]
MSDHWKKLRILTTNHCSYNCEYCHNEGHKPSYVSSPMSCDDFVMIMEAVKPLGFEEIIFSGGDPLLNPATVDMIEWADNNTDHKITVETNGSAVTDEIAARIGNTRAMLNVHYPAAYENEYRLVTGCSIEPFTQAVRFLDKYRIPHVFNFVLHPDHMEGLDGVIDHVIEARKQIELLPYVESGMNNISAGIIRRVTDILDSTSSQKSFEDDYRITVWTFGNGGKVKLIKSPCYDRDIDMCKGFGELRILPDLTLQKCRFDDDSIKLGGLSPEEIRDKINVLRDSFTTCI